jgi:hypothetical protein
MINQNIMHRLIVFILVIGFTACKSDITFTEKFDSLTWKADKNGCKDKRLSLLADLENIKSELINVGDKDLLELLGKPDKVQLYDRHQRFFYYYVENGEQCGEGTKKARRVAVRLNSLNLVSEISVEYR